MSLCHVLTVCVIMSHVNGLCCYVCLHIMSLTYSWFSNINCYDTYHWHHVVLNVKQFITTCQRCNMVYSCTFHTAFICRLPHNSTHAVLGTSVLLSRYLNIPSTQRWSWTLQSWGLCFRPAAGQSLLVSGWSENSWPITQLSLIHIWRCRRRG